MKSILLIVFCLSFITVSAQTKKQKVDSTKYYYNQYLKLKNKHVPDSLNIYYKKLMYKK